MSDNLQRNLLQVILCDMCTEEDRKPARKTCMKCEISMCVQHLQAHVTTPVLLQTHPLTEPMALCGTKCPQHDKLLEYYCLDDMTCVCVACAIEGQHRVHNMKTFSTAHKELTEELNNEQRALLGKTDDGDDSLEKWEKSEREKLGRSSVRLVQAVTGLRDIVLTSVQSSVSARMASIKTSKSSMQAAQEEKDTFRFLQMYSQVYRDVEKGKAVDLRKGSVPGSDRDKLLQEIRQNGEKMAKQAGLFWGSLLSLVDPENHQELIATNSDVIFDPQTLDPGMSLSKDKRKLFYTSGPGHCSSATLLIRHIQTAPTFQRWVVSFSQDCDWTVGLCDQQPTKNVKDGHVFGLCCEGNELSALTTAECDEKCDAAVGTGGHIKMHGFGMTPPPPAKHRVSSAPITHQGQNGPRPEVVEVFWYFGSSLLSFFSRTGRHQREEIITLPMSLNNWDLAPFVQLSKKNGQSNPQQIFSQPKRNQRMGFSLQFGGDICTTEVVCELQ